ncbi:serine/threonine protein kinase [Labilithrix luteola]|uniref:Serine/threonine protein kinase n=1 Tax=Labilithrix luteola TaxID=1391654 RepID=A0A0K1QCS5_9BACT|nr:serine/threonine-protein kinase [Labilithrix luteola]AKV03554.1 serine/threonine protein kinase [Labilithrix luteola]
MSQPAPRVDPSESAVLHALDASDPRLGETLGKYRLVGALGHGGMADVYLAVADGPEGFRKLCVLKMLKDEMAQDEDFRAMFLDEARLAARLNHPNVVQTFESGETQGRLMLAMEYVEGQPVSRLRRRLSSEQFMLAAHASVLCDVLEALSYAHGLTDFDGSNLGIVHRDVSPHNILVGYDGRVKLVDFGIAKSAAAMQMTQAGVLKGKIGYMAPEQASLLDVDGRADIFSVGVILWEAIAGRRLADGLSASDVLVRRVEGREPKIAEVVPDVDPELAAMCDRAMHRDPAHRYASAADFQTELERWLAKHGAPSRKLWAKALRDAFAPEREQLRALVEHRLADSSGMRQSVRVGAAPSRAQLVAPDVTGGERALNGPETLRTPSGSTRNVLAPEDGGPTPAAPGETASIPARTVSLTPPPRRRSSIGIVAAVATIVVLGSGTIGYVVSSRRNVQESPRAAATSLPVAHEPEPPPAASPPTTPTVPSASPVTVTTIAQAVRPVYAPPQFKPPATNTRSPATPSVTTPHAPPPQKTPSRPLDEKDPYAP